MDITKYLKNLGISLLWAVILLITLTFLMTLLHYFNIIGSKTVSILKIAIPILSLFISGFMMGRHTKKDGWLEGLKLGFIFILFLLVFNYLAFHHFLWTDFIYYLILLITTTFGSMLGINQKKLNT